MCLRDGTSSEHLGLLLFATYPTAVYTPCLSARDLSQSILHTWMGVMVLAYVNGRLQITNRITYRRRQIITIQCDTVNRILPDA